MPRKKEDIPEELPKGCAPGTVWRVGDQLWQKVNTSPGDKIELEYAGDEWVHLRDAKPLLTGPQQEAAKKAAADK